MTAWPEHYPEKCPPDNAVPPSGSLFRFINKTNPKKKDFLSYYELKPEGDWGTKACVSRGLSVYASEIDCAVAAATIPALKKKQLAKAFLPKNSGVIASTPSKNTNNHKTLWPLISAEELAELFSPVQAVGVTSV